jgi:hypothetical protein
MLSCDTAIIKREFYVKPLTSQIKSMADKSKIKTWKSKDKAFKWAEKWPHHMHDTREDCWRA